MISLATQAQAQAQLKAPSENKIWRKQKHKQNHPNFPNCLGAKYGNKDPMFSLAKHNHIW